MMLRAVAIAALVFSAPAMSQAQEALSSASGGSASMGKLLTEGYEIKTSVLNGTKLIVFMQKDKTAYACEFVTLTRSRCGVIN
jgi:hypothetical protein